MLLGARQVGKTTILRKLFPEAQYLTIDNQNTRRVLERYDISAYRQLLLPSTKKLIIDEIQLLSDPGRAGKIFFDQLPEIKLMLTGSSAFNIKNKATESLAGRRIDYEMFPLTLAEYGVQTGVIPELFYPILRNLDKEGFGAERVYPFDVKALTDFAMLYGLYPAIISHAEKEKYLQNLVDSVVFRDLLDLSVVENRRGALELLKLLAYQIGGLVNFSEIATKLQMDVKTVRRYIGLFEQSYIIFSITPYFRSRRKEIGKMTKIYFYDCGLRNALIGNFNPLDSRNDVGALFENLIFSEAVKANVYGGFDYAIYYWRTTGGSKVDLVLERGGELVGAEIKFSPRRTNVAFLNRYPLARLVVVTPGNFL